MAQDETTHTYAGKIPAELIAGGRAKFTLSQARLRQRQAELALLSLVGSLNDVLRSYLLLRHNPAGAEPWPELLAALRAEADLSDEAAERMQRMQRLCQIIARGESVTLTHDTILGYQQFAAAIMAHYGVPVVSPETPALDPPPAVQTTQRRPAVRKFWQRYQARLLLSLLIGLIFVIGATATIALQQNRALPLTVVDAATPAVTAAVEGTRLRQVTAAGTSRPTRVPPDVLMPGRIAFVRTDVEGGLALRERPGMTADATVRIYLSVGTAVEVLAGPVMADGYSWWQVRAANQDGWCAGEFLEVR